MELLPRLRQYALEAASRFDELPPDRRALLEELASFVRDERAAGRTGLLTFICTHNSRRSQIAQLWAAAAASYFGVAGVKTFSGGTETTAFDTRAIDAITRAGFQAEAKDPSAANPRYRVRFSAASPEQICYSKLYDDPANPSSGFAAVLTCSSADADCPVVSGAALRVSLPWDDPKSADGTAAESATYDERTRQIAVEMLYLFSRVRAMMSPPP